MRPFIRSSALVEHEISPTPTPSPLRTPKQPSATLHLANNKASYEIPPGTSLPSTISPIHDYPNLPQNEPQPTSLQPVETAQPEAALPTNHPATPIAARSDASFVTALPSSPVVARVPTPPAREGTPMTNGNTDSDGTSIVGYQETKETLEELESEDGSSGADVSGIHQGSQHVSATVCSEPELTKLVRGETKVSSAQSPFPVIASEWR
ncbi:hypothetical protein FS749_002114, partial [Ceratobasidium sp. UAMH 11750]